MVLRAVVQKRGQPQNISSDEALIWHATHRCLNRKDILDDEAFVKIDVDVVAITHDRSGRGWRADRRLAYRFNTKARRKLWRQNRCVSTSVDECRYGMRRGEFFSERRKCGDELARRANRYLDGRAKSRQIRDGTFVNGQSNTEIE